MKIFNKILISVVIFSMFLSGCTDKGLGITGEQASQEVDKVKIELIDKIETSEGIEHSIKIRNGSSFAIKDFKLSLSYPIKTGSNGQKENKDKIEATGNISSGCDITLKLLVL